MYLLYIHLLYKLKLFKIESSLNIILKFLIKPGSLSGSAEGDQGWILILKGGSHHKMLRDAVWIDLCLERPRELAV